MRRELTDPYTLILRPDSIICCLILSLFLALCAIAIDAISLVYRTKFRGSKQIFGGY